MFFTMLLMSRVPVFVATSHTCRLVVGSVAVMTIACRHTNDLYCDEDTPCTRVPGKTFCDLEGVYPESDGHGRTCIAPPFDAGTPDAMLADAGSATDAFIPLDAAADAGPDPGMVIVAAGPFSMGCNVAVDSCEMVPDELPYHMVQLADFAIDVTEVTQAAYENCVVTGACTVPASSYSPATTPNRPVVGVTWQQAFAYCAWAGKRLPTEAEWEKAARGTDGRKYPWGNEVIDCTRANYAACNDGNVVDVGGYPASASPYGALDMAGNAREWVADWYSASYYSISPPADPTGPGMGSEKVMRGGTATFDVSATRASARRRADPTSAESHTGFRCAK